MYQNMFEADKLERPYCPTIKPCWIPQISNFIPENSNGMNTCTKVEDYDCMIHVFGRIKLAVSTKCEEHCEETTYRVSKSQTPIPETSQVRLMFIITLWLPINQLFQAYYENIGTTMIELYFARDTILTSTEYEVLQYIKS